MTDIALDCYRNRIIHIVTGNRPAMVFSVTDNAALLRICQRLVEAERAAEILLHKGYGRPGSGMLLHELAALVPEKG
jgi:hypothetical protein